MVVNIKPELSRLLNNIQTHFKNRLRLGISGYSQLFFYSVLFCYPSFSYAGPDLSGVHGGDSSAVVHTHGLTTDIHQNINSVIVDWNSFNVQSNETVNFFQPTSSSIALNKIHSASASDIRGQINANGNIILVNPNGVFFGATATVNVGGLIASGLEISNTDFLNGDYIFTEKLGADGFVINSGVINASIAGMGGGNVTLLGKQVTNNGTISANLGSVNLAAGKAAVLTFDQQGLLGVRVTEAILQNELGVDPAVLNSGDINAEGGRVLLSASVSRDVFSQAVNTGSIEQATSVVVNEDGSFALGAGADVINTGDITVSTTEKDAGQIVLLGNNVTSSGSIIANSENAQAGLIELHATDTALLTEQSRTEAVSKNAAKGGDIKLLGNRVGLFDQSTVDASGDLSGGSVLIGGDFQGKNEQIQNAEKAYVSKDSRIIADAKTEGDGGKVIVWADDTTRFYGNIFARGGVNKGNGGFAEVSGKQNLEFKGFADLRSPFGRNGSLLLDPKFITISTGTTDGDFDFTETGVLISNDYDEFSDSSLTAYTLNNTDLVTQLGLASVTLQANTDIDVDADVIVNTGNSNLILNAGRTINLNNDADIVLNGGNFTATINDENARANTFFTIYRETERSDSGNGDAKFNMTSGSQIVTNGGSINITAGTYDEISDRIQIGDYTLYNLSTAGADDTAGGAISLINSTGRIYLLGSVTANAGATTITDANGNDGGLITITATSDDVRLEGAGNISSIGSAANGTGTNGKNNAVLITSDKFRTSGTHTITGGFVDISSTGSSIQLRDTIDLTLTASNAVASIAAADANEVSINADIDYDRAGTKSLTINAAEDIHILKISDEDLGNDGIQSLAVTLNADTDADGSGDITLTNQIHTGGLSFIATAATFNNNNNNGLIKTAVDSGSVETAGSVSITTSGNINLGAIETTNEGGGGLSSTGALTVKSTGGTIIQGSGVDLSDGSTVDEAARIIKVSGDASFIASDEDPTTPSYQNIDVQLRNIAGSSSFGNEFAGSISLKGQDVTLYTLSAIDFGASTINGDLVSRTFGSLGALGDITQSDAISVNGVTTLIANDNAITLLNANNDFVGNVNVDNSGDNAVADIQIRDVNDIKIGIVDIRGGTYTVTAGGNITLEVALDVEGFGTGSAIVFNAVNDVNINNAINDSVLSDLDNLSVTLNADTDNNNLGTVNIDANINTYGSGFTVTQAAVFDSTGVTIDTAAIDNNAISVATSGAISITTTGTDGRLIAGTLTTSAGKTAQGLAAFTAGNITLVGAGDVDLKSTISSVGGHSGQDINNNNGGLDGGKGGDIDITSTAGSISVANEIVSTGGNNNQRDNSQDDATGGQAGFITLTATTADKGINLGANLTAVGGQRYEDTTLVNYGAIGQGNDITLEGKVTLASNIMLTTFDNQFTDNVSGVNAATVGEVKFTGTVNATNPQIQTLTTITDGANVTFDQAIGNTMAIGDLLINPAGSVTFSGNVTAKTVTVSDSTSFTSNSVEITTTGLDTVAGGNVNLQSSGLITVGSITAEGGAAANDANGLKGGDITLLSTANNITVNDILSSNGSNGGTSTGLTDTAGGDGGGIYLTADSGLLIINGDLTSVGGAGQDGTDADSIVGASGNNNEIKLAAQTIRTTGVRTLRAGLVDFTVSGVTPNQIQLRDSLSITADNAGALVAVNPGEVLFNVGVNYDGVGANTNLIIVADNLISLNSISDADNNPVGDILNVDLTAKSLSLGGGIFTQGGTVDITSVDSLNLTQQINTGGASVTIDITDTINGTFTNTDTNGVIAAGNVTITTQSNQTVDLGSITTTNSGGLSITTSDGSITQTDTSLNLTVAGTTTLDSGTNLIDLSNAGNNFGGQVAITALSATIQDANDIMFGKVTTTSFFNVVAGGGITQSGVLAEQMNIAGDASFSTGASAITLGNVENNFSKINVVNTGANAITVNDTDSVNLGLISLSGGSYTVTADADITLVDALDINNFGNGSSLNFQAGDYVNINALISDSNLGADDISISLNSDMNLSGTGDINIAANINTYGGSVELLDSVILTNADDTTLSVDAGSGNITFNSTLDGTALRKQSLSLVGNALLFYDDVGATTRLGSLTINAAGDVLVQSTAATPIAKNITASSLNVINSNQFVSANIDTSESSVNGADNTISQVIINADTNLITGTITTFGASGATGLAGGDVTLAANTITVDTIDTQGGDTSTVSVSGGFAGDVLMTATEIPAGSAPSITLMGDINSTNGNDSLGVAALPAATVNLSLVSTTTSSVTIEYLADFTSLVQISGDTNSLDTFNAVNRDNTWSITGDEIGALDSNITFNEFENLIGQSGIDTFNFTTDAANIEGLIDGGTSGTAVNDTITLFSGATTFRTVQLAGAVDQEGNNVLEINNIETITADATNKLNNELLGVQTNANWFITGSGTGFVGDATTTSADSAVAEGRTLFSNFNKLTGGAGNDTFAVTVPDITGDLMVITGSNTALDIDSDKLIGSDIDSNWSLNANNGGILQNINNVAGNGDALNIQFSHIENLTAGSGNDNFDFGTFDVDGSVIAGGGTDTIDYSSNLNPFTFDFSGGINGTGRDGFEKVKGNGFNHTLSAATSLNDYVWNVTDNNTGEVYDTATPAEILQFTGFNNLQGAVGDDTFNITDTTGTGGTLGNITGLIDGGTGGNNILNIYTASAAAAVSVQLDGVTGLSNNILVSPNDSNFNNALDVINLSSVNANSGFDNTLFAADRTNAWTIDGSRSGSVNSMLFVGFRTLTGADNFTDTFLVTTDTTGVMTVNGGLSDTGDFTDYDTLTGAGFDSFWNVNAPDAGSLADDAITPVNTNVTFSGMENLVGGNLKDDFTLTNNLRGTINGGASADDVLRITSPSAVSWTIDGTNSGTINTFLDSANSNASADDFSNIENIISGTANDTITLNTGGSLDGLIDAGAGADTLVGFDANTSWEVTALNTGNVNGVGVNDFTNIENLTGRTGIDDFTLNGGTLDGVINGGTGADDSLQADDIATNTWEINGTNQGKVNGLNDLDVLVLGYGFTDVEALVGGNQTDNFSFTANGVINQINGGAGTNTITGKDATNIWSLASYSAGSIVDNTDVVNPVTYLASFTNIEILEGGAGVGGDTLIGFNNDNTWTLSDNALSQINSGSVADTNGSISGSLIFSGIENITGGTNVDTFNIEDSANVSGNISGGNGDDIFNINGANAIATIVGGNGSDELVGANEENAWAVNGATQTLTNTNSLTGSITFSEIEELTGGNQNDTFSFTGAGAAVIVLGGGGSLNIIEGRNTQSRWLLTANNAGGVTDTSLPTDEIYINQFSGIETIKGGTGIDTLIGGPNSNTWTINATDAGANNQLSFTSMENLTGTSANDTFNFVSDGAIHGYITGLIDGGSGTGSDTVSLYTTGGNTGTARSIQLGGNLAALNANAIDVVNIETFSAEASNQHELIADVASAGNAWLINNPLTGTINGLGFSGFSILTGTTNITDSFTVATSTPGTMTFNGGAGDNSATNYDTISGSNDATIWNINNSDAGLITDTGVTANYAISFTGIENLMGDAAADQFILTGTNGSLRGTIDGGSGGNNSLTGGDVNNKWVLTAGGDRGNLTGLDTTNVNANYDFINVSHLIGGAANDEFYLNRTEGALTTNGTLTGTIDGGAGSNSLYAGNVINTWTISAAGEGNVTGVDTANTSGVFDFTNVTNLFGNVKADTFYILPGAAFVGSIDGGVSTDVGEPSSTNAVARMVDYDSIILGDASNPFITDSSWTISGTDSGSVTPDIAAVDFITFSDIEHLTAGAGNDAFKFTELGSLRGLLDGSTNTGGGTDSIQTPDTVEFNVVPVDSLAQVVTVLVTDIYKKSVEDSVISGTYSGPTGNNSWFIETPTSGYVIDKDGVRQGFSGPDILLGSDGDDVFTILNDVIFNGTFLGGSGGVDTITAYATANGNSWDGITSNVTGVGLDGILNGSTIFEGFETLYGNATNDTFTFADSSAPLSGSIYGINPNLSVTDTGVDTFNANAIASLTDLTWDLINNTNGAVNTGLTYTGIETINGSSTLVDTVNVMAGDNLWDITSNGSGTLNKTVNNIGLSFTDMDVFNGNINKDAFNLSASVNVGTFNGVAASLTGTDVGSDSLTSNANAGVDNVWEITGNNAGTLNTNLSFSEIDSVSGGASHDRFIISSAVTAGNLNGGSGGTNSVELLAEAGTDTDTNEWIINTADSSVKTDIVFNNITSLVGNDGVDNFTLNTDQIALNISGGLGIDSLNAFSNKNTWVISNVNTGSLSTDAAITTEPAIVSQFDAIENLAGNTGEDKFTVEAAGRIAGIIDAGAGIGDDLDLTQVANSLTVKLGAAQGAFNTDLTNIYFNTNNFENVTAAASSATIQNTIVGADADQVFVIDGINSGAVGASTFLDANTNLFPAGAIDGVTRFTNFENIQGGIQADLFRIVGAGEFKSIDGGTNPADLPGPAVIIDSIALATIGVIDLTVGQGSSFGSKVNNVEGIGGNNTSSILRASDAGSVWTITGPNSGTVTSGTDTTNFTGFNILQGGSGVDEFNINVIPGSTESAGGVSNLSLLDDISRINGGAGNDRLIFNLSGLVDQNITLFDGNGLTNVVTDVNGSKTIEFATAALGGSNSVQINSYSTQSRSETVFDISTYSPGSEFIKHTYTNSTDPLNIISSSVAYTNVDQIVNDNVFVNTLTINGTDFEDAMSVGLSRFSVSNIDGVNATNNFIPVNYFNKSSLNVVAGLSELDSITLTDNMVKNNLLLSAETINRDGYKITADILTLDGVRNTDTTLITNIRELAISNSDGVNSDIRITDDNGVDLSALELTGSLRLLSLSGDIIQSADLISDASLNLSAQNGAITLTNDNNALSGRLNLSTATSTTNTIDTVVGSISLNNTGATNLGSVITNTLSVESTGDITDSGALIAVNADFSAGVNGASGSINLNSATNDFNVLALTNTGLGNINIVDINAVQLGNVSMGVGSFQLNSVGVTQGANTNFIQEKLTTGLSGDVIFNSGAAGIDLSGSGSNQFSGAVSLNNSGNNNVTITDASDDIVFGLSNLGSGVFTVNALSGVSQIAAISQEANTNDVVISAGLGGINLMEQNSFSGGFRIRNQNIDAAMINNINDVQLLKSTLRGDLTIVSSGSVGISQSALSNEQLFVAGDAFFFANQGASIILNNSLNNLQGGVSFNSNSAQALQNVSVTNIGDLTLGAIEVSNNLDVVAGGEIDSVQGTGIIEVGNVAWFDATLNNQITLTNASNDFNEVVFVRANSAEITDINDISIGTSTSSIRNVSTINGDLSVVSKTGGIQDVAGSTVSVVGITSLDSENAQGDIDFSNGINNFSQLAIKNANSVTLLNAGSIDLQAENINGFLNVTAGGNITNVNGALIVAGDASFTSVDSGSVVLDNVGNDMSGSLVFMAANNGQLTDISITNARSIDIQAVDVSNNLTIVSAGDITQSGAINVANETSLTALNNNSEQQNILLGSAVNDLGDLYVKNAKDVTIDNSASDLVISEMNASGNIDIRTAALQVSADITAQSVNFNANGVANFSNAITSNSFVNVVADGITIDGAISAVNDSVIDSLNGDTNINNTITVSNGGLNLSAANINQNANVSTFSNITVESQQAITMNSGSSSVSTNGDINYISAGDLAVSLLSADSGDINVSAGVVTDVNGDSLNFNANKLTVESVGGFGSSNQIETQVSSIDLINTGSGNVQIQQSGNLEINQLRSEISNGLVDVRSDGDFQIDQGSIAVNYDNGSLFMSTNGDFIGSGLANTGKQDITGFSATFISPTGAFGRTGRPMVLNFPKAGEVVITTRTTAYIFSPVRPDRVFSTGIDVSALGVVSAIASELRVEIETLGDVDPAIFTDLQNYSLQDISIRMPRDQLFEDELDEYERLNDLRL